jgi:hypothetical protein
MVDFGAGIEEVEKGLLVVALEADMEGNDFAAVVEKQPIAYVISVEDNSDRRAVNELQISALQYMDDFEVTATDGAWSNGLFEGAVIQYSELEAHGRIIKCAKLQNGHLWVVSEGSSIITVLVNCRQKFFP